MSCVFNQPGQRRRAASGFTLLELIIVLVVLAALAALVVPTLGFVRDQANSATAAAGAAEVMNNLETFKASTGGYPDRLDSLVGTDGSVFPRAYSGASGVGTLTDLASSNLGYYMANGGISSVMQHNLAEEASTGAPIHPNESTSSETPTSVYSAQVLVIDPVAAAGGYYVSKVERIVRTAFPNQSGSGGVAIPDGHTLVALGVGGQASCVGTTMASAPVHSAAQSDTYSHFIAVFDVWAGGTGRGTVQLKMVLDSEFEVLAKNLTNYKATGPVDVAGEYIEPEDPEESED